MSEFQLIELEEPAKRLSLAPGSYLEYTESQMAEALRVVFFLITGWLLMDSSIRKTDWVGIALMSLGVGLLMGAAYGVYRCSNPTKHRLIVTEQRLSWGPIASAEANSLALSEVAGVILDVHDNDGARVLALNGREYRIEWDFFQSQERPDHFFLRNGIELIESPEPADSF